MKTLYKITIIAFFAFLIFNCGEEKVRQNKLGLTDEETNTVVLGLILNSGYSNSGNGTVLDNTSGLEWKKCTQGQTFRSATNDCQGTISATYNPVDAQRYGATPLTFCNINGNGCNATSLPQVLTISTTSNGLVSEAFSSCAADRTSGYSNWRVATFAELKKLAIGGQNMMTQYFPNTVEDFYWSSWGDENDSTGNTAKAINFTGAKFAEEKSVNKDTKYYVRCIRNR